MMLRGDAKAAEDTLKRMLRRQEKEKARVCIGFFGKGSREFYFTTMLSCPADDLQAKLSAFREWKHYLKERNGMLSSHMVTTGSVSPDGITRGTTESYSVEIDLDRPCLVHLVIPKEQKPFYM